MFVVKELVTFPEDAVAFHDEDDVHVIANQCGLQVNDSMCAGCPPVPPKMQFPHLFAHAYADMEMLVCGQEEWQMTQIVHAFVKENNKELTEDTQNYFSRLPGKQSVSRYALSLSRKFLKPDAAQVYLLAHACNIHTRVRFMNCVWSTIEASLSHYVALDVAAVGKNFVPLCSLEQESIECVVGHIQILIDPDSVFMDSASDMASKGVLSDVDVATACDDDSEFDQCPWAPENAVTKPCFVRVEHLSGATCLQLTSEVTVQVERLSKSLLHPGKIFKPVEKNKSMLFPGRIFRGKRDWSQCEVPRDKLSVSTKMPGYVFSDRGKPVEKPLRSLSHPGTVFRSVKTRNVSASVHGNLQLQVRLTPISVQHPCCDGTVHKFNCLICGVFVDSTRAAVKRHIKSVHGRFTCKNAHCMAAFKTEKGRDMHSEVHNKKMRVCTHCHQVFGYRYLLEQHMVCHAKVRKHRGQQCGCKYFRNQDLKEHLLTAHNAFTYQCDRCSYAGQSSHALKQHALVHKAPKLKCSGCDAAFHWRSQCTAHVCK